MKFDVILANPPYDNGLHVKFEAKYFELCKGQICWVSPLSFLLGKKQNRSICDELDKYSTDIESINGNDFFDAALPGTMGIVYVDMENMKQGINFNGKDYNKSEEIRKYTNDDYLMAFKSVVEPLYTNDNLDNHLKLTNKILPSDGCNRLLEKTPNLNWICLHISRFAGSGNIGANGASFYTIVVKNDDLTYSKVGKYSELFKEDIKNPKKNSIYFSFNNEKECYNFINYTKSYFARICLYLRKTSLSLCKGEMTSIPWFDFSDPTFDGTPEEIDITLFRKYGVSKDIVDHIIELLPNYYGLDLTKYECLNYISIYRHQNLK